MRENRSRKHTGLCCRVCAILGTVGMAALSASAGEGEVITDKLTAYDESKFYGDVTIKLFDVAPPTNAGILNFNFDTDEGGVVTDQSGNGNTGVVSGAVWTSAGYTSGAYVFDGAGDYIQATDSDSLDISGAFTISLWAKIAGTSGVQGLVCKHNDAGDRAYAFYYSADRLECQITSGGSSSSLYDFRMYNPNEFVSTNWNHLVVVWGGVANSGGQIYVNGNAVDMEATVSTFVGTNIFNSSQPLRIGSRSDGNWFLNGVVDEVQIYDRPLSSDEIKALEVSAITNAQFQVSVPTAIEHLIRQGDIEMGAFTNEP